MTYILSQYLQRWEIEQSVMALRAFFVEMACLTRFTINAHAIVRAMTGFFDLHRASIVHSQVKIEAFDGTNDCVITMTARIEAEVDNKYQTSAFKAENPGCEEPYFLVYNVTLRESVNSACSISLSTCNP